MSKNYLRCATCCVWVLVLVSCVDPGVSNKINAAKVSLTLAENTYVKTCRDVPTLVICVDPMKTKIKELDMKAYNAVKLAEGNEELLTFALSAIGEFTAATSVR